LYAILIPGKQIFGIEYNSSFPGGKVKTNIGIQGPDILINNSKVYSDLDGSNAASHGLLFNARFIQGIFDDKADPGRFARFGFDSWDPEAQTDRLIDALPEWYSYGLRAFTVGIQGGGPCFTVDNSTIENNPFGADGKGFDPAYAARLDRLIKAADEIGMVAIVSYFYGNQTSRLVDGKAVREAVAGASRFLKDGGYTNVIIEVANEQNIKAFDSHPIVQEPEGMAMLIDLARDESGGMLVGCSGGGGAAYPEIARASDIILVHGNGQSRQNYCKLINRAKSYSPGKPVVCNEDSQAVGQMLIAGHTHTSWGYYNNLTKQEPPTRWQVLPGEDMFFALRMADLIGMDKEIPEKEDQYYLHGFEPEMTHGGERWIRLGSLYPESIDFVEFFRNNELFWTSYDESFSVNFDSNWKQGGVSVAPGEEWKAIIHLRDGSVIEKDGRT
jgi:hypothetical protein